MIRYYYTPMPIRKLVFNVCYGKGICHDKQRKVCEEKQSCQIYMTRCEKFKAAGVQYPHAEKPDPCTQALVEDKVRTYRFDQFLKCRQIQVDITEAE